MEEDELADAVIRWVLMTDELRMRLEAFADNRRPSPQRKFARDLSKNLYDIENEIKSYALGESE